MRGIPDALLGCQLARAEPMGHQCRARRIAHTVHIAVQYPERTYQINQSHRCLSLSVQQIEDPVQFGRETDGKIYDARQHKPQAHQQPLGIPVCQKSVYHPGHSVYDTVESEEDTKLDLAQAELRFHCRDGSAEILAEKVIADVAQHQGYKSTPLPAHIFCADSLIHLLRVVEGEIFPWKFCIFAVVQNIGHVAE